MPRETFVWAQGRAEWQPLHAVPELAVAASSAAAAALAAADASGAAVRRTDDAVESAGGAAPEQAAAARPAGGRATTAAAPAVVIAAAAQHDPMAAFTADISAIEAVSCCLAELRDGLLGCVNCLLLSNLHRRA